MQVRRWAPQRVEQASWKGSGVQLRAYVEPELRRRIIEQARRENITMSEVVRRSLRRYFDLREIP